MKTKLITILFATVALATTPVVYGQSSVISNVNNTLDQLKSAAQKAESAYSNAEVAVKSVVPSVVSNLNAAATSNTPVTTNVSVTPATTPTNSVAATTNSPSKAKETINDAVIGILNGAKSAGGDIYQASKTAITKAVDFTMEEAPLVVKEFLHWRLAEAVIHLIAWSIVPIVLLCIGRAFYKRSNSAEVPKEDKYKTDQNDYAILKWVFRTVAFVWLAVNITTYGLVITKIAVAPRVYLIEYVVKTIHDGGNPPQNN